MRYVCEEVVGAGNGVGVITCADQQLGLLRGQGRRGKDVEGLHRWRPGDLRKKAVFGGIDKMPSCTSS